MSEKRKIVYENLLVLRVKLQDAFDEIDSMLTLLTDEVYPEDRERKQFPNPIPGCPHLAQYLRNGRTVRVCGLKPAGQNACEMPCPLQEPREYAPQQYCLRCGELGHETPLAIMPRCRVQCPRCGWINEVADDLSVAAIRVIKGDGNQWCYPPLFQGADAQLAKALPESWRELLDLYVQGGKKALTKIQKNRLYFLLNNNEAFDLEQQVEELRARAQFLRFFREHYI